MKPSNLLLAAVGLAGICGCSKPMPVTTESVSNPQLETPSTASSPAMKTAARSEADDRAKSAANFRAILLAIHNYEGSYGKLPWNIVSDQKPPTALLSWRVRILPYMGQETLYKKFHLNEPWDSERNKAMVSEMPAVYAPVRKKAALGETFYQAFVGKDAIWETAETIEGRLITVTDGMSNTFAVVEAGTPVIWTKPEDISFDSSGALPKLGADYDDGFYGIMLDGVVRFISKDADPAKLKAAVTKGKSDNLFSIDDLGPDASKQIAVPQSNSPATKK